jgi:hypothetical protein
MSSPPLSNATVLEDLADRKTGWIDLCGFLPLEHERRIASTHTIASTLGGVHATSRLLGVGEGLAVVERAAGEIATRLEELGWFPGVLDSDWRRRANYACVTGAAQMALLWMQLFDERRARRSWDAAGSASVAAEGAQAMRGSTPGILGGIPGSDPVWGAYSRFAYPNWEAKFFADALLEKRRLMGILG